MRRTSILAGLALVTAAVVGAPAGVATAESPADTIGLLEAQGYHVNVDRIGSAPIEECVVVSVRNPQTVTRLVRVERTAGTAVAATAVTTAPVTAIRAAMATGAAITTSSRWS